MIKNKLSNGLNKGKFIVIDGLDGIGKSVVLDSIVDYLRNKGQRVLDLHEYWDEHGFHPDFDNQVNGHPNPYYVDLNDYDVIYSSEPTHVGIGKVIRQEVIAQNGRPYPANLTAECYSTDRLVLYQRVILPALNAGKTVIQSRSVSTSIVYQPIQSEVQKENFLSIDEILSLPGNKLALDNAPDLLIIPTIKNVNILFERLAGREKDDNCNFEKIQFQERVKPLFEGKKLRKIFEKRGSAVKYLDAGISIESTKKQAVDLYKEVLEN
jgi:thymidylate kinase